MNKNPFPDNSCVSINISGVAFTLEEALGSTALTSLLFLVSILCQAKEIILGLFVVQF